MACPDCAPTLNCPPSNPCNDPCNQPDPCSPAMQLDATAIFYNLCTSNTNNLSCSGLPNGTNLKTILDTFDAKLCQYVTPDFSRYNLSCLRQKYTITNQQQFAESVAKEICIAEQQITALDQKFTTQIANLTTIVNGILYPRISDSCGIGISLTDSINTVLTKLVNFICANSGQPDSSPNLIASNSNTISFVTSGPKGHNITASVNISPTLGNVLQALGNGLYVPTPPTQVPQVLSIDYTTRIVSLSNGGGFITLPPDLDNQTLSLNIPAKTITITNGNTIDLTPLFQAIAVTQTPNNPQNTNSISITASGTANTTFSANLNVDNTQPNAISVSPTGVLVAPEQVLVANNSSTLTLVASGTDGHTLTGAVKVDGTQPNAVTINANGLYVDPNGTQTPITTVNSTSVTMSATGINNHTIQAQVRLDPDPTNAAVINSNGLFVAEAASGTPYTADNGLTQTINNTQLGGTLVKNTLIDGASQNYDVAFNGRRFIVASDPSKVGYGTPDIGSLKTELQLYNEGTLDQYGLTVLGSQTKSNVTNPVTLHSGTVASGSFIAHYLNMQNNINVPNTAFLNGSQFLLGIMGGTGSITTATNRTCAVSTFFPYRLSDGSGDDNGVPTIDNLACIETQGPYLGSAPFSLSIDNFYHLYLEPSDDANRIPNRSGSAPNPGVGARWGVYQIGANDTNYFNGFVGIATNAPTSNLSVNGTADKTGGGSWGTFSDERLKENINDYSKGLAEIEQIRTVTYNYKKDNPIYANTSDKTFVGVIAQEIQPILPETIEQKGEYLSFDSSELVFTLINAVKTLSSKINDLEAEIKTLKGQAN